MIDDAYVQTASACFELARNAVPRIDPTAGRSNALRDAAEREIVYLLVHFLSRLLFDVDRSTINERMSALATATLQHYAQAARDDFLWAKVEDYIAHAPPDFRANNAGITLEQYKHFVFGVLRAGGDIPERPLPPDALNSVSADATNRFMISYCDRQFEYGSLDNDWFRLLLVKFGKHFCEAVGGDDDLRVFFRAESEAVQMFDALGDYVPQLLSTPTT
jgi:hypothetical protein